MSLVLADRVRETTQTTGTGTITLDGAVQGFQSFAVIGNNNTTYYTINRGAEWEVGVGTYYGGTLSRDTVYESSNSNNKVNFSAGAKDVFVTLPSEQTVTSGSDVTFTKVTTPTVQATNSGGLSLKNSAGTTQISMGAGGGDNISLNVSTNLNGTNAQIDISPTGTGHVHMKPSGTGSIEVAPTNVGTMDNITIGATTAAAGTFTTLIGGGGSANYGQITGGATTKAVEFQTLGSDSNIALVLDSKGTGAIDLAAGSSGVNISNGGTVTVLTRTAAGSGYTAFPNITISAPTTAGGVQATASVALMIANAATIQSGGTGYTLNDVVTLSGGTPSVAGTFTVTAVSGGVVTAVSSTNFGTYSVLPSNPVSVTGGTGTGLTLNVTWAVGTSFTITNAGSGYVEQPTVTFSSGSATAYATVGSVTTIKSLGSSTTGSTLASIQFVTPNTANPNYPPLTIRDIANADTGILISPNTGYTQLIANAASNGILMLGSFGTSSVYFNTNGTSQTNQMRVSHTASAVNYVQVTGSATGGVPTISAQGSDSTVALGLASKGAKEVVVWTNTNNRQFLIAHTASPVNYATVTGSISGSAPVFGVAGTDTNIDLTLTPKGTGVLRFGTLTATADTAISGYITIKDSGGTTRKLAVIT